MSVKVNVWVGHLVLFAVRVGVVIAAADCTVIGAALHVHLIRVGIAVAVTAAVVHGLVVRLLQRWNGHGELVHSVSFLSESLIFKEKKQKKNEWNYWYANELRSCFTSSSASDLWKHLHSSQFLNTRLTRDRSRSKVLTSEFCYSFPVDLF